MIKRIIAVLLCVILTTLCFTGCRKKNVDILDDSSAPVSSKPKEEIDTAHVVNPFTGIRDLDKALADRRPVAVMINNINFAQKVQTGLNKADIIYETVVEGGITRLMAVYKNIEAVDKIGSLRSARYPYIDLALGHDAVYIHCGQDPTYAKPHLNDIDHVSVGTNVYAVRIKNGLATEHTLYSDGSTLWSSVVERIKKETTARNDTWQKFASEKESISFEGSVAQKVNIPYSCANTFVYDATTGLYTRNSQGAVRTDYFTGEEVKVKNLFVLNSVIRPYPDNYRMEVLLDGGTGYYAVNGTYTPITWKKGGMNEPMKFYDAAGKPLTINTGNSWVCIVNESTTHPTFE